MVNHPPTDITSLDDDQALDAIGGLIDLGSDQGNQAAIEEALTFVEHLRGRGLRSDREALLWYFTGNAWSSLRQMRTSANSSVWEWEQPEFREEVIALRQALHREGFLRLDTVRRCQIPTNLGNLFSTVGRFIGAVEHYDRALAEDARFGMALGNKAMCLTSYARSLYDPGHQHVFAGMASRLVEQALSRPLESEAARTGFIQLAENLRRVTSGHACSEPDHLHSYSLGEGEEATFRSWALRERLFLNPLNDLGPFGIAANDILHLPTMTVDCEIGTGFHGFYNQLKQEFASARWLLFEGLQRKERHLVDRDLVLLDTLDGTAFGLSPEKLKLALRSAYSLLDKSAVFLATYFGLKVEAEKINFRTVWYQKRHPKSGLWPLLVDRENWPLRGLFWLAKDLHEADPEYHAAIHPEAQETATLRNHLEHRYVKVLDQSSLWTPGPLPDEAPPDPFALRIERAALEAKALRMVKTARAALVYLSLAVHAEERGKVPPDAHLVARGELPRLE